MKTELEPQDIEVIAGKVIEKLKPLLSNNKHEAEDVILNVQELALYLKVTPKWVYEQTHLKTIPHLKLSNKQLRFKRKDIDKWLDTLKTPSTGEPTGKLRLLR
jgi:excisionase family DNA binding protein